MKPPASHSVGVFMNQYSSAEDICKAANNAVLKYLGGARIKIQVAVKFKSTQSVLVVVLHLFAPRKTLRYISGTRQLTEKTVEVGMEMVHSICSEACNFPLRRHEM